MQVSSLSAYESSLVKTQKTANSSLVWLVDDIVSIVIITVFTHLNKEIINVYDYFIRDRLDLTIKGAATNVYVSYLIKQ